MNFNQLKYFQSVAANKSFSEAAEECYISQSAISQQIKALEQELGTELIKRQGRKFELTEAGELFYLRSFGISEEFDKLCRDTIKQAHGGEKLVRIGFLRAYTGNEIAMALAEFSSEYPDITVETVSGNHEELYRLLSRGSVDIAVNDQRRVFSEEYVNMSLGEKAFCAELSRRNKTVPEEKADIHDMKDCKCILVASPEQRSYERDYFSNVLGFGEEFIFAGDTQEARMMAVGNKGYFPSVGGSFSLDYEELIRRIPLYRDGRQIMMHCCAFWKKTNDQPHIRAFADMLKKQFHK